MKKVLFIIPDYSISGTNSSMLAMLNRRELKETVSLSIVALSDWGPMKEIMGQYVINSSYLLSCYYADVRKMSGLNKICVIFVKFLKYLSALVKRQMKFNEMIIRKGSKVFNLDAFDVVVAFQEGDVTYVCAELGHPNKIAWIHGAYDSPYHKKGSEEKVYRAYNSIVCVSQHSLASFRSIYPDLSDRTFLVNNYIDYHRIRNLMMSSVPDDYKRPGKLIIVSIGRIAPVKRYSLIPGIAGELKRSNLSFVWYIVGPIANMGEYEKIKCRIEENGVRDEVILLGAQQNPYPYYHNSDLLVSLSASEADSMVFHEAIVCGIPILSSDFPTAKDSLKSYTYGYVVNVNSMAAKILELSIDNPRPKVPKLDNIIKHNEMVDKQLLSMIN